ncbi:homeobox protein DBX1-like [Bacillus rossius redtenbacheri]|uniref:homeobox protein DBX1-like n=1 Tax=Bacillus rossius redtenbacheri TaxID=93214 RepID=UPI002FDE36F4
MSAGLKLRVTAPNSVTSGGGVVSSATATAVFPLPGTFPWANSSRGKPRRGMMRRAVFSDLQRKGLEKRFQIQKYISKPDRKKLAEKLGLKDSQSVDRDEVPVPRRKHAAPNWSVDEALRAGDNPAAVRTLSSHAPPPPPHSSTTAPCPAGSFLP